MQQRLNAMNYKEPPYSVRYPELLKMGDDPRRPANNQIIRNLFYYSRDDIRGLSSTKPGAEAVVYDLSSFDAESTKFLSNFVFHNDLPIRVAYSAYKQEGSATLSWEVMVRQRFRPGHCHSRSGFYRS